MVLAKTLFTISFSTAAVTDVVLSPSFPKDNTTRLQILLKVSVMGRATAWTRKHISDEMFVFTGLKLPAHSGPGNSHLLSCFLNFGSPSSLGVHSHSPFHLFSHAHISKSPKSPSPRLPLESRSISSLDCVVHLMLPFYTRLWSPPLVNLKMHLGIHLSCKEGLSLLSYVKAL